MDDSLKILTVRDEEKDVKVIPPKRRSLWCWLRRHRMYVAGYDYHLANGRIGRIEPIRVCQCKLADTDIPSLTQQMGRAK